MTASPAEPTVPDGWRLLAYGAGFVEGPVWHSGALDFVSVNRGLVYRAQLDGGGFAVRAEPGGGPNGAASGADGRLWVVQNAARAMDSVSERTALPGVQIVEKDGSVITEIGRPDLNAPNDCAFGPDGRLWFTDPYGRLMPAPPDDPERSVGHGRVWAYDSTTSELELIATGMPHPNGLCFDASGERLYVNDTRQKTILTLDLAGRGPRPPVEIARLPEGKPDGMAFDVRGRLWIAATDAEGLCVLSADGSWEFVPLGRSFPTNVCFAGPDLTTVVVTAARGGRVLARDGEVAGLPLY